MDDRARPYEQRHETSRPHLKRKGSAKRPEDFAMSVRDVLDRARFLGFNPSAEDRILDFGCGVGGSVSYMLTQLNLDAYGVDVYEFWGKDHKYFYDETPKPPTEVADRLKRLTRSAYRSPFPDGYFDFVFSNQVFEHVFDRTAAMREIGRVLKPRGLSVHIFPGPAKPRESHTKLPIVPLCRSRAYLTAWALLGYRNAKQRDLGWRDTVASNINAMRYCYYPSLEQLRANAADAGVAVSFEQSRWVEHTGRFEGLLRLAGLIGARKVAARVLGSMSQRFMVIQRLGSGGSATGG